MKTTWRRLLTVATAVTGLAVSTVDPAHAAIVSPPVAGGFVGPLGMAVGTDGTVYVAEAFAGTLTAVDEHGLHPLVTGREEIAGVWAAGKGSVVFVSTTSSPPGATLERARPGGRTQVIGNLGRHEEERNPDKVSTYGLVDLADGCVEELPVELGPLSYRGLIDSHPYAVTRHHGGWVVADAAGNDLVRIDAKGRSSTFAVLPPQPPLTMTPDVLGAFNEALRTELGPDAPQLPECVIGASYVGEPVPTDVEVGPDDAIYVTTLPGFPELPGSGSVWRVRNGTAKLVGTGFTGAVDLAIAPDGTIYVAELFAGRISMLTPSGPAPVASIPFPTTVEYAKGKLWVTSIPGFDHGDPLGELLTVTP